MHGKAEYFPGIVDMYTMFNLKIRNQLLIFEIDHRRYADRIMVNVNCNETVQHFEDHFAPLLNEYHGVRFQVNVCTFPLVFPALIYLTGPVQNGIMFANTLPHSIRALFSFIAFLISQIPGAWSLSRSYSDLTRWCIGFGNDRGGESRVAIDQGRVETMHRRETASFHVYRSAEETSNEILSEWRHGEQVRFRYLLFI